MLSYKGLIGTSRFAASADSDDPAAEKEELRKVLWERGEVYQRSTPSDPPATRYKHLFTAQTGFTRACEL